MLVALVAGWQRAGESNHLPSQLDQLFRAISPSFREPRARDGWHSCGPAFKGCRENEFGAGHFDSLDRLGRDAWSIQLTPTDCAACGPMQDHNAIRTLVRYASGVEQVPGWLTYHAVLARRSFEKPLSRLHRAVRLGRWLGWKRGGSGPVNRRGCDHVDTAALNLVFSASKSMKRTRWPHRPPL